MIIKEILHGSVVLEESLIWKVRTLYYIGEESQNFLRRLSVPVANICVRYYAITFNILTVRTRFKGRVLRRKSFNNSSHQASERNCVLYRTYRPPYHISHNLRKLELRLAGLRFILRSFLFYFLQCLLLRWFKLMSPSRYWKQDLQFLGEIQKMIEPSLQMSLHAVRPNSLYFIAPMYSYYRIFPLQVKWNINFMQHCSGFISAASLYMFRAQAPIIRSI